MGELLHTLQIEGNNYGNIFLKSLYLSNVLFQFLYNKFLSAI